MDTSTLHLTLGLTQTLGFSARPWHAVLSYGGQTLFMKLSSLSIAAVLPLFLASPAHADAGVGVIVQPPQITIILQNSLRVASGLIFVAPKGAGISGGGPPGPLGPEIVDDQGRPVWFSPLTNGQVAGDFRVQRYRGRPVLTWAQEKGFGGLAQGESVDYILDRSYHLVATVHAGNGLNADAHEFLLSPEDTALITIYNAVARDLSSVGGSSSGQVIDGVVQEIDVATGSVLFEWHSLDHVGLDESYQPLPPSATTPWDYFHLNAVSLDEDGNLLLSARHTSAVYKLERRTGRVVWRLGGKKSDFDLGPGVRFWYQHNPIADGRDTIRLFDNESNGTPILPSSRVIWVQRDPLAKTATLVRSLQHPEGLSAASQGGSQALDNGDTFVGWGAVGRFSEFDSQGLLIFDARVPSGYDTYRAYRFRWHGDPDTKPTATAQRQSDGHTIVHAIWNGATEVARWDVLNASGGDGEGDWDDQQHGDRDDQQRVASVPWNGLDTTIFVEKFLTSIRIVARDRDGREIGWSLVTAVSP